MFLDSYGAIKMSSDPISTVTGPLVQDTDFDQYKEVLSTDVFPRDANGDPEDNTAWLGTLLFRFLFGYFSTVKFSDVGASIVLKDTSGELVIEHNGNDVATIDDAELNKGITIAHIADLSIGKKSFVYGAHHIQGGGTSFGNVGQTGGAEVYTGINVTITTSGRPVLLVLENGHMGNSVVSTGHGLKMYRNGVLLEGSSTGQLNMILQSIPNPGGGFAPIGCYKRIDTPAAGTYTYTINIVFIGTSATSVTDIQGRLHAIEL